VCYKRLEVQITVEQQLHGNAMFIPQWCETSGCCLRLCYFLRIRRATNNSSEVFAKFALSSVSFALPFVHFSSLKVQRRSKMPLRDERRL